MAVDIDHRVKASDPDGGVRLDRFLAQAIAGLSRARIKTLIAAGRLATAGTTITDPNYRVKPGQQFVLAVPPASPAVPRGQAIPLQIVYEDADLVVVDKAAGMVVHPAPGHAESTLVNALISHCGASLSGIGGVRRPGIVHRLDKDTSGLLIAAKNDEAHAALSAQFASRTLSRSYTAVVRGVPTPAEGAIDAPIGRDPRNRKKMAVVAKGGRPALTRYRLGEAFGDGASVLCCRLASGRTHQIRVHLSVAGHPLIGDPLYGRSRRGREAMFREPAATLVREFPRQALHAHGLRFRHPRSRAALDFESPLPPDIIFLLGSLRRSVESS